MSLTATIGGASVTVLNALTHEDKIDEQSDCSLNVIDQTGTAVFTKNQPVAIVDTETGATVFAGFVNNQPAANLLYPNPARVWALTCRDQTWRANKRTSNKAYANQFAGAILVDQVQRYGSADGLTCKAALRWDELLTEWQAGTLSGTVAATNASSGNAGDGDLELALAGSKVVVSGPGAGFSVGNGLLFTGYCSSGYSSAYVYRQIWTGSITVATGDTLSYDVWVASNSPQIKASVNVTCSDGTTFNTITYTDGQGLSMGIASDLSGLANNQWYSRQTFFVASLAGKTVTSIEVVLGGTSAGTYTAYFRRIIYTIAAGGSVTIFGDATTLTTNTQTLNLGYSDVSLTQVSVENKSAFVTHAPLSIGVAGIVQSSQIVWDENFPSGSTGVRETSIDGGASWQVATNGGAVPNLLAGMAIAGRTVQYRDTLTVESDPTTTCGFGGPTLVVSPSYASAKTDAIASWTTATDFAAGTLADVKTVGSGTTQGIATNGFQWDWKNGFPSETSFGSGFTALINKQQYLNVNAGDDLRLRLDAAGQWQNFTTEVDVQVPASASASAGLVYRTTGWQNTNDTYAYAANISINSILLGKGTNSSSGAGAFTSLQSASVSLVANSTHRLKVVANGNTHQIYLDGVLYITKTDSTYPAAGYIGLRTFNGTGSSIATPYGVFGVCSALSGTWQSPSINIAGPGTYGNSIIQWDIDGLPDGTTSITAQTSIDGGATWQNVSNGGAISGLSAGQSLTGKTLLLKLTLNASNAPVVPVLNGVTVWIMGQYSSTGTRSNAPLGNDLFQRANQSGWGTSTDLQPWTMSSGSGTAAISSNTGTLTATGGGTTFMHLGSQTAADMAATNRVKYTNAASAVRVGVRYTAPNTMYTAYLSNNGFGIQKFVSGVVTTLASMTFMQTLGSYYQLQIVAQGTTISAKAWLDGSASPISFMLTATDASIASGGFCVGANLATGDTATFNSFTATLWPNPTQHLSSVGRAGTALVNWNANVPTGTALTVQTSVDGGATYQAVASPGNAISGIGTPAAPQVDGFATNTSADYTASTFGSVGDVSGAWTWDTANSRLVGTGGVHGSLLLNTALATADGQVAGIFDECDGSGLIANAIDANDCYYVQAYDASGTGTQNALKLFKRAGGVNTQLGSTITLDWPRGRYRRLVLDVQAGVLVVSVDGITLLTQTDGSPLAAGHAGLLLGPLARCYRLRAAEYGQDVTAISVFTRLTLTSTDPTLTPQVLSVQTFVASEDIAPGALIPDAKYLRTYLSDNFADLNTKSATTWTYVRPDNSVAFRERDAMPAPWVLDSANKTNNGLKMQGDLLVANLNLTTSGDLYRNRQILTGVQDTGIFSQSFAGDGSTRTWNVANPLVAPPTIMLNGQVAKVGVKGVDTGRDFYYQLGSTAIDQDSGGTLLQEADSLSISYSGSFVTDVQRDNATAGTFPGTTSQAELAAIDGTSGIVENVVDVSKLNLSVAAAEAYGDQLLAKYGVLGARTLTFDTLRPGLAVGQQLTAFVPEEGCINAQLLIIQIVAKATIAPSISGGVLWRYSVSATEGANLGSAWRMLSTLLPS